MYPQWSKILYWELFFYVFFQVRLQSLCVCVMSLVRGRLRVRSRNECNAAVGRGQQHHHQKKKKWTGGVPRLVVSGRGSCLPNQPTRPAPCRPPVTRHLCASARGLSSHPVVRGGWNGAEACAPRRPWCAYFATCTFVMNPEFCQKRLPNTTARERAVHDVQSNMSDTCSETYYTLLRRPAKNVILHAIRKTETRHVIVTFMRN